MRCSECGQEKPDVRTPEVRSIDAVGQYYADAAQKKAAVEPARSRSEGVSSLEAGVDGQLKWYEQRARDHWARMGEQGA